MQCTDHKQHPASFFSGWKKVRYGDSSLYVQEEMARIQLIDCKEVFIKRNYLLPGE